MFSTIVSTTTVAAHLDGSWAIVDCRFDLKHEAWGREQYLSGHIPGAVYASLATDLSGHISGTNGRHPLPSDDDMAATFGRFGIDSGTQVVVYDQDGGMYASRLWWMLRYLGHDAVSVLDGGWEKWTREGRPVRSGQESRGAVVFNARARANAKVTLEDVAGAVGQRSTILIDARAPERFEGRSEPLDRAAGHIPGAVNHFYRSNLSEKGTLLPAATLREKFETLLDSRSPAQAVIYCGSGVTACHNLLAMAQAGLDDAKLYPGSWSEWSSDPARPVEKGPAGKPTVTTKPC